MKKLISKLVVIGIAIFVLFSAQQKVEAKDEKVGAGFSVSNQFNNNQIDPNSSYYYLMTKPGEKQSFKVKIQSTQKEPVKIKIRVTDAYTSKAMQLKYDNPNKAEKDDTLKNPVTEMIEIPAKEVTVQNFETKEVEFKVKEFKENYEGVKLGAIIFEGSPSDKEKGAAMSNSVSYEIGVILASNGEQFNIGKELKLLDVKSGLDNGQISVSAKIQNPEPYTIENLSMKATIKEKESGKVVKTKDFKKGSIAPNNTFYLPVEWGLSQIKPGKYLYVLEGKNDLADYKLEKEFTITGKDADSLNDKSAFKIVTPTWIKITVIAQAILVIIILIVIIIRRKKFKVEFKKSRKQKKKSKKGARK